MVILRGKVWYARITVRTGEGTRRQKWISLPAARTEREARKEEARLTVELTKPVVTEPSKEKLASYLGRWLDGIRSGLATQTAEGYERLIRCYLVPQLGEIPLGDLTHVAIRTSWSALHQSGARSRPGQLSARTVLHCHRLLSQALKQAVDDHLIARNPCDTVKAPSPQKRDVAVIDETQVMQMLGASEGTRLHLPILLALTTGLRRGEILALRWSAIDLAAGTLTVRQSMEHTRNGIGYKAPKSRSSRRTILLLPLTVEALRRQKASLNGYHEEGLVVNQGDGQPITPGALTQAFRSFLLRAKLPPMRFHDLRHTHASLLIKHGTAMKAISTRLGHAGIGITMDTYGHLLPGVEAEAVQRLEGAFREVSS